MIVEVVPQRRYRCKCGHKHKNAGSGKGAGSHASGLVEAVDSDDNEPDG